MPLDPVIESLTGTTRMTVPGILTMNAGLSQGGLLNPGYNSLEFALSSDMMHYRRYGGVIIDDPA
jgi:hypothetical protein